MSAVIVDLLVAGLILAALCFVPHPPIVSEQGGRLSIGRSLLTRGTEMICLFIGGLLAGYSVAMVCTEQTVLSVAACSLILVASAATFVGLNRRIRRSTLVVDRDRDTIMRGKRLIARVSDVAAVHVMTKQPAVLVLRADAQRYLNSPLPLVETGDGQFVGSILASYLEVALLRIERRPLPSERRAA